MTNVAISALPAATTPLTGTEIGIVVQGGVTSRVSSASQAAGGRYIDCRDFAGLDPTGSSDSSGAINAAIQAGVRLYLPIYLPEGTYKIASPLLMVWNVVGNYTDVTNIEFFGAGIGAPTPNSVGLGTAKTIIKPTFNTMPAIACGPMGGAYFHDFAIEGLNVAPQQCYQGGTPGYPVDNQSDYITAGCRLNKYSPYCGIAIDTLNVANPGGSSSNQYPGMTYYGGAGGSNFCTFENLLITGFVVGIAYGISGLNANSDDLVFRNVQIFYCDTAYACGNTQADNCVIDHGNLFVCRQGLDYLNYGGGTGSPPRLRNVNLQFLYRVFTVSNSFGPMDLDNCYAESIRALGNFGVGAGSTTVYPLTIRGGTYSIFGHGSYFGIGPAAVLIQTYGPSKFLGTSIVQDGSGTPWIALNAISQGSSLELDHCTIGGPSTAYTPPVMLASFDTAFGQIRTSDCVVYNIAASTKFLLSDDYPRGYPFAATGSQFCPGGRFIATYQSRRIPNGSNELIFQPYAASAPGTPAENTVYTIFATVGSVTLHTSGAGSLTFTVQSTVLQPGDVLMWGVTDPILGVIAMPSLAVTSYTYSSGGPTTCTCAMLFDPILYSSSPPIANQIAIVLNHWAPATPLTCTTHSTSSITAVSPITILQNGDGVVGSGIAYGTRVVSGGGTASITLSQAASSSASGVTLYFGRLYAPTLTAAF